MKDFFTWLLKNIVDDPEKVEVSESEVSGQLTLQAKVAKEDMGRVIGKSGKIIKSLRNLIKARALKENKKVFVNLAEEA